MNTKILFISESFIEPRIVLWWIIGFFTLKLDVNYIQIFWFYFDFKIFFWAFIILNIRNNWNSKVFKFAFDLEGLFQFVNSRNIYLQAKICRLQGVQAEYTFICLRKGKQSCKLFLNYELGLPHDILAAHLKSLQKR